MMMGVYPKVDKPYMFGLHQCSYARAWTPEEERLFNEIGRRLGDALTSLLTLRNLRESERRLEEAQRLAHVGWWDRDFVSGTITLSEEAYRILCVAPERRIQYLAECERHWQEAIHPQDRESVIRAADAALGGGPRYDVKYRITRLDGELRTVRSQGDVTRDEAGQPRRMFGFIQDITELKHAEEQLCASLREKEVLLKEVHHRVKNNLQLISSLLSLQAGAAKNREVADVLIESQNRVRAMALVHEYLYRSADLPSVRLADYIQSLSTHLYHSYNVDPERIALEFHVGDVAMDLDRSIRCGLIINELVSNAIKHAFPGGRKGRVTINLCSLPDGRQSLTVSDNGVGLPPDVAPWHTDSIGLQLVADLTDQLGGTLTVSRDGGTTINIKCSATKQGGTNYTTH
jgi:two-component sensor histidine kinase/PAS domain-containing protein